MRSVITTFVTAVALQAEGHTTFGSVALRQRIGGDRIRIGIRK